MPPHGGLGAGHMDTTLRHPAAVRRAHGMKLSGPPLRRCCTTHFLDVSPVDPLQATLNGCGGGPVATRQRRFPSSPHVLPVLYRAEWKLFNSKHFQRLDEITSSPFPPGAPARRNACDPLPPGIKRLVSQPSGAAPPRRVCSLAVPLLLLQPPLSPLRGHLTAPFVDCQNLFTRADMLHRVDGTRETPMRIEIDTTVHTAAPVGRADTDSSRRRTDTRFSDLSLQGPPCMASDGGGPGSPKARQVSMLQRSFDRGISHIFAALPGRSPCGGAPRPPTHASTMYSHPSSCGHLPPLRPGPMPPIFTSALRTVASWTSPSADTGAAGAVHLRALSASVYKGRLGTGAIS